MEMNFFVTLKVLVVILGFTAMMGPVSYVYGSATDTVTLPCMYPPHNGVKKICWIRGDCSAFGCSNATLQTRGTIVTERISNRYEVLGNITQGDASLTITGLTTEDDGTYCCKVYISGPNNNVIKTINIRILETETAKPKNVTLPCIFPTSNETYNYCWGQSSCLGFLCSAAFLRTNGREIREKPDRYEILGNMKDGNMSLTITNLTKEDEGVYCCKSYNPSMSKTKKTKNVILKVLKNGDTSKGNILQIGNIIRGALILLLPILVLILYNCCSL